MTTYLRTEDDLIAAKALKPKAKFARTKFTFVCSKCGKESAKNLMNISFPFICRYCALVASHNTSEYVENHRAGMIAKYGISNYHNVEKCRQTAIEHYGSIEAAMQSRCKKMQATMEIRYGAKFPNQVKEFKEKTAQTKLDRYGSSSYNNREKAEKTVIERYGSVHQFKLINAVKANETKLAKYGNIGYNNREKASQTLFERYGADCPMHVKSILDKCHHKYTYMGLSFDSSYDLAYYIWLSEAGKNFTYQPDVSFTYDYDGIQHIYNPDYSIDGKLYELKGIQFFENKDPCGKMVNPYDHSLDALYEAKHQCMIANGVTIVSDCSAAIKYVSDKYTSNFIQLFRNDLPFPYLNDPLTDTSMGGLIHHFHKSIYAAHVGKNKNALEAWADKDIMRNVALNRIKYKGRCLPSDILQGFNVTKIAPKVSVFSHALAKRIIENYLNEYNVIFDPFSGFSGRMLGAYSCGKNYIGQDINSIHAAESNQIIQYLSANDTLSVSCRDIFCSSGTYEALFTCSPYSLKERWNETETDLSCDEWIDECLSRFKCKRYAFVVDHTEKYADHVVETISNKSHFSNSTESVVII